MKIGSFVTREPPKLIPNVRICWRFLGFPTFDVCLSLLAVVCTVAAIIAMT